MSLFSLDSSSLPSQAKKVDCHDLPSKSRKDNALFPSLRGSGDSHNEAIHKNIKTQKVDFRIFTQTAQSVETLKNAGAESAFDTKAAGDRILR